MMKNVSIEQLKNIKINKKIKNAHDGMYDNVHGDEFNPSKWDRILEEAYNRICWFLSKLSQTHDLNDVKVIFDVGSLNGAEAIYMGQILPHAKVYSFDANPIAALMIRDNQKQYDDRFNCIQKAVSDYNGTATFHLLPSASQGASSLLKPIGGIVPGIDNVYTTISVECTTIEQFCKDNSIDHVDLLWIDAQGTELNVLKGIGPDISKVKTVYAETGKIAYYENHTLEPEITAYLQKYNFVKQDKFNNGNIWEEDNLYIRA